MRLNTPLTQSDARRPLPELCPGSAEGYSLSLFAVAVKVPEGTPYPNVPAAVPHDEGLPNTYHFMVHGKTPRAAIQEVLGFFPATLCHYAIDVEELAIDEPGELE